MSRIFMFDAYGTLFDVHSIVKRFAARLGPDAQAISALWRTKQLEYTWIYSALGQSPIPAFQRITDLALGYALDTFGQGTNPVHNEMLEAYLTIDAFPDVEPALNELRGAGNKTAVFTNASTVMVDSAIKAAGLRGAFDYVLSVEDGPVYKPHPSVYETAMLTTGTRNPADIVFISSNRWDIAGAAKFGFTPIWCNRNGQPGEYQGLGPVATISTLAALGEV